MPTVGPSFYFGSVLYEPHDPDPDRRFKMVFWDIQRSAVWDKVPGLYTAVSADGVHWRQQEAPGTPSVIGGYGNPGVQPPLASKNASSVPSASAR